MSSLFLIVVYLRYYLVYFSFLFFIFVVVIIFLVFVVSSLYRPSSSHYFVIFLSFFSTISPFPYLFSLPFLVFLVPFFLLTPIFLSPFPLSSFSLRYGRENNETRTRKLSSSGRPRPTTNHNKSYDKACETRRFYWSLSSPSSLVSAGKKWRMRKYNREQDNGIIRPALLFVWLACFWGESVGVVVVL